MDKDLLGLIFESIEKSQQRARKAFFLSLIVSCLVIVFAFNFSVAQGNRKPEKGTDGEAYKILLQTYLNRYTYTIPVLGISVGADDFSFFGPTALFIFSFYFVSCLRNSVLQLKSLRKRDDITDEDLDKIAVAISSEVVLNTRLQLSRERNRWIRLMVYGSLQRFNVYRFLILLPLFACLTAIASEIRATYFIEGGMLGSGRSSCGESEAQTKSQAAARMNLSQPDGYQRDKDGNLIFFTRHTVLVVQPCEPTYFHTLMTKVQRFKVISFEVTGGIVTLIVGALCLVGIYYSLITERLINEIINAKPAQA